MHDKLFIAFEFGGVKISQEHRCERKARVVIEV